MGWHIHTKNGKFNIWSTVTDSYLLTEWANEQYVKEVYITWRLEEAQKSIKDDADTMIKNAKESGFCGLPYMRCNPVIFEQVLKENIKLREKHVKEAQKP